ncbi:mitochondrial carrier domain-containing protein, putative [Eimeria mitis]|uniref:Mitochondrial carrier domain-containing protein, putative n=1 Tax=Eimeria mitis TaxID=44415 RepID=U6K4B2_9EIME|nr:mitochondrial carrier domain-containing protein, putative [Eimeria mitis]CDJ31172.1 mitochondrial carrier domain-containing protein, putative [Eimeria mitis]
MDVVKTRLMTQAPGSRQGRVLLLRPSRLRSRAQQGCLQAAAECSILLWGVAAAGAVAAVVTTPMDVVKTRLMTQAPGSRQYRGFFHCLGTMLRREGLRSLFLGVQMRCLWVALGGGIFLGGYDAFSGYYRHLFERNRLFESQCCNSCSSCSN